MLDNIQKLLRKNLHRFNVSHHIFCQKCETILDCKKSVSIDLCNDKQETVKSFCFCNNCFNTDMKNRLIVLSGAPQFKNASIEIFHGKTNQLETIPCN